MNMDGKSELEQKAPLLSIILPTWNRAHLIGRMIKSLLEQPFTDYEIIVVDDGSTDQTDVIVAAFADQRIMYLRQDNHQGVSMVRNIGIEAAKGKYITLVDSDDYLVGDVWTQMIEAMAKYNVDVLYSVYAKNSKEIKWEAVPKSNRIFSKIHKAVYMFRLGFLRANGIIYPPGIQYAGDTYFTACAMLCAQRVGKISQQSRYQPCVNHGGPRLMRQPDRYKYAFVMLDALKNEARTRSPENWQTCMTQITTSFRRDFVADNTQVLSKEALEKGLSFIESCTHD